MRSSLNHHIDVGLCLPSPNPLTIMASVISLPDVWLLKLLGPLTVAHSSASFENSSVAAYPLLFRHLLIPRTLLLTG